MLFLKPFWEKCSNPIFALLLKKFSFELFKMGTLEIGLWCNGSTTDFDSVCLGSNPSNPTVLRNNQVNFIPLVASK